ncbi:MAG: histidine phosphatase family protein [Proteobacteria bacterium]|nr:histidine phosphatase family protein [Pseudomonadota bacterium]
MSIYLIRHGESEFNAVFSKEEGDPLIFDAKLTEKGHKQSRDARILVKGMGIQRVITSPLTRAIQTALHMFEGIAPIEVTALHREMLIHSCDVGRSPEDLKRDFPGLSFDHLSEHWWYQGELNGDSVPVEPEAVFLQRIADFKDELLFVRESPVAYVGHGTMFRALSGQKMENCEIRHYQL